MATVRKTGNLASVRQKLAELSGLRVAVGVLGAAAAAPHKDENGESHATVAEVATWNHFGTSAPETSDFKEGDTVDHVVHIPARPFISLALENHKAELQKGFERIGRGVLEDKLEARQALGLMGESVVGAIKTQIADGVPPSNAESTKERKRSSVPLIDKGQLRSSVSYQVRDKT
jgi:phage gpG-like protein